MLEEGRDYEGVERLRELFKQDVNVCAEQALKEELEHLKAEGKGIYPLTQQAYEYFRDLNKTNKTLQNQ